MESTSPISPAMRASTSSSADATAATFEEAGVVVTAQRVVVYGQPFPLSGIRGTRLVVDRPHLRFAIPVLIAGLALGAYGVYRMSSPLMFLGFMLVVVSYLTYKFQTMRHQLRLVRDSGETEVLISSNLAFAQRIQTAIDTVAAKGASLPAGATGNAAETLRTPIEAR